MRNRAGASDRRVEDGQVTDAKTVRLTTIISDPSADVRGLRCPYAGPDGWRVRFAAARPPSPRQGGRRDGTAEAMSTPVSTARNPWGSISQANRVRVHERGRICAHDGCATILSIYNPEKYCSAHQRQARRGLRGVAHPVLAVACENCGEGFTTRNPRRRYCSDRCRMAAFARRKRSARRPQALAVVGGHAARWEAPDDAA